MTTKILLFTMAALSALLGPIQMNALGNSTITMLYSTGQGLETSGPNELGMNPPSIVDPHWTIIQAPTGASIYGDDAFTNTAGGRKVPASSEARWIGPKPSSSFMAPVGDYTYQTTFSLAGFVATSAMI